MYTYIYIYVKNECNHNPQIRIPGVGTAEPNHPQRRLRHPGCVVNLPNTERERFLYWQPTGPNPFNHRDGFSRPALYHGSLNLLLQAALYLLPAPETRKTKTEPETVNPTSKHWTRNADYLSLTPKSARRNTKHETWKPAQPTARWSTTLPSKVNLPHAINFRAVCGANLLESGVNETLELDRVDPLSKQA